MPQNKPSIYPTLALCVLVLIMAGMLVFTPPRNNEPVVLPEPRTVAMPMGFTGPMSQDWMRMEENCPGEELVRLERPEGLPEAERDMWTCARFVEVP